MDMASLTIVATVNHTAMDTAHPTTPAMDNLLTQDMATVKPTTLAQLPVALVNSTLVRRVPSVPSCLDSICLTMSSKSIYSKSKLILQKLA